jgi:transcriptional regulator with XRE-family HTH domain
MNIIVGENLKELRKKKNNTQEDLAEFLSVSITAVSKWERGECYPDIELIPKIASYYDVSVDNLLGVKGIKKWEYLHVHMIYDASKNLAEELFENNFRIWGSMVFFIKTLNDFGAMGWECVNYNDDDMSNNPRVFFKRPL